MRDRRVFGLQKVAITKRPKSIILFDEIEKANKTLHNILLNIIDKAELILANGTRTDFSNSVIIMTSNAGSRTYAKILNPDNLIGFNSDQQNQGLDPGIMDHKIYQQAIKEIKNKFLPEFLGRFDEISVYRPLNSEILRDILEVEIQRFQDQICKKVSVKFCFDEDVKDFIASEAIDKPEAGARLTKKKIRDYLLVCLCRIKNKGDLQDGDTLYIFLEEKDGKKKIGFSKDKPKQEENKENSSK